LYEVQYVLYVASCSVNIYQSRVSRNSSQHHKAALMTNMKGKPRNKSRYGGRSVVLFYIVGGIKLNGKCSLRQRTISLVMQPADMPPPHSATPDLHQPSS